ncbi:MAG TPA: response regulator transcription factor [Dehalococcoidia bacterium]|nr:response regulator transcription factor [Dehalococcoidia bacterium]
MGRPTSGSAPAPEASGPRVLVVDDDERLLLALSRGLRLRGFQVALAADAAQALPYLDSGWPQVVVLDVMLPGTDGLTLCQRVRQSSDVPILMLTARDSVPDRVAGLEAGADDYLVKPFSLDELVARLRALLRRAADRPRPRRLAYADLELDLRSWRASRGGQPLPLTATEFRLLELFLRRPEEVLRRDEILAAVWGDDPEVESNVVDVHVANLRQKMEAGGRPRLIQTVRGVGYVLRAGE